MLTPTPTTAATAIPYTNFGEEMSLIAYISFAWMYSVSKREREEGGLDFRSNEAYFILSYLDRPGSLAPERTFETL